MSVNAGSASGLIVDEGGATAAGGGGGGEDPQARTNSSEHHPVLLTELTHTSLDGDGVSAVQGRASTAQYLPPATAAERRSWTIRASLPW